MIKKLSVETTVDMLVDQIIQLIIDGVFKPGQKIPTESELAASFGVGRNSIREAVKILSAYGVLEIRRADGTFVCSHFSPKMLNPMIYGIILEDDVNDLVETRKMVETYAYHLAIQKATDGDLSQLKASLDEYTKALRNTPNDYKRLADLDDQFHDILARCGHNQILTQINKVVLMLLYESRMQTIKEMIERGDSQFLIEVHTRSYNLILEHRLDKINAVVEDGIMNWDTYLKRKAAEKSEQ